jgi:hypothetical protein
MKRRVRLKLEALDNRIVPSGGGSKPGGVGDGVSPYMGPSGAGGEFAHVRTLDTGKPDTGIVLLGGSKPSGAIGSSLPGDTDAGIVLFSRASGTGVEV